MTPVYVCSPSKCKILTIIESVDKLLEEINSDKQQIESLNNIHGTDSPVLNYSPTKPLNFPRQSDGFMKKSSKRTDHFSQKDFNSSSDTCISDEGSSQADEDAFARNFEHVKSAKSGAPLQETLGQDNEEFAAAETPMNSTLDLLSVKDIKIETSNANINTTSNQSSPSKSIMRKGENTFSPVKKSVAFTQSNPEIHRYPGDKIGTQTNDSGDTDSQQQLTHNWAEVVKSSLNEDSDDHGPEPPLRKINSLTFLETSAVSHDVDIDTLRSIQSNRNSLSRLSLNEKLDVLLSKNPEMTHELDEHLMALQSQEKIKTEKHIQGLSSDMRIKNEEQESVDDPLNSLKNAPEIEIKRCGSSQSSLLSLNDSNRMLESSFDHPIKQQGIELKDGIKGFSNEMVEAMIPQRNVDEGSDNQLYMKLHKPEVMDGMDGMKAEDDEGEIFHDSFDNTTEQSILKLLDSNNIVSQKGPENNESSEKLRQGFEPADSQAKDISNHTDNTDEQIHRFSVRVDTSDEVAELQKGPANPKQSEIQDTYDNETYDDARDSQLIDKFSIRDHVDQDWKLEDSNDGDKEDNDEFTTNDLNTTNNVSHVADQFTVGKENILPETSSKDIEVNKSRLNSKKVASDETTSSNPNTFKDNVSEQKVESKSVSSSSSNKETVPKVDEAIDATSPPIVTKEEFEDQKLDEKPESYVLANSSNIAPPEDMVLPQIESQHFSSFEELAQNINAHQSYEDELSAENEVEKERLDYLSIWHSQERQKRSHKKDVLPEPTVKVESQAELNPKSPISIPSSLVQKKFKEVNVRSRRIVSSDFEDLQLSGFLPELSDTSGFASKFEFLDDSVNSKDQPLNSAIPPSAKENVLSEIEPNEKNTASLTSPVLSNTLKKSTFRTLRPQGKENWPLGYRDPFAKNSVQKPRISRFRVPSIEIKRSESMLSPKHQYDDIFEDVLAPKPPTITSLGMKTLPSMNKDDVKKIMATKKMLSQEEYTALKLVGNSKSSSIVHTSGEKFDKFLEHASLCDVSADSCPKPSGDALSHLVQELSKSPKPLLDKEKPLSENIFDELGFKFPNDDEDENNFIPIGLGDKINKDTNTQSSDSSKSHNQVAAPHVQSNPFRVTRTGNGFPMTDISPKKEAIKINPKVKLNKTLDVENFSVSPIKLSAKTSNAPQPFTGSDIQNKKLRGSTESNNAHQSKPSTLSVPTIQSDASSEQHEVDPAEMERKEIHDAWKNKAASSPQTSPSHERGRLFFKVIGLKDINLPDISKQNSEISMILDNGVHCVKTSNYKMDSHDVQINKEFELIVGDSLEFILTMKAKYNKPKDVYAEKKEKKVVKSKNRLSRLFGSKYVVTTTRFVPQKADDPWKNRVAIDGSFARCYVDLSQYENKITGNVCSFDITCFNEWDSTTGSKSNFPGKRGPYKVGSLEVKMLFIPRTESTEIFPSSIKSAYQSICDLQQEVKLNAEGYLHQEGGDCEIWKRRYFKLEGNSLLAHSEFSHKTRAKINLSKVVEVIHIDNKEDIQSSANKVRNFSDVILVPHSFKIKFRNGEMIDFSAPSEEEKSMWVETIKTIVQNNTLRRQPWVRLMLERSNDNDFFN